MSTCNGCGLNVSEQGEDCTRDGMCPDCYIGNLETEVESSKKIVCGCLGGLPDDDLAGGVKEVVRLLASANAEIERLKKFISEQAVIHNFVAKADKLFKESEAK